MSKRNIAACLLALCLIPGWVGAGARQPASSAQLPAGLDPLVRSYGSQADGILRRLKQGIEAFEQGSYAQALGSLPDDSAAGATRVADYALLYRARAQLMLCVLGAKTVQYVEEHFVTRNLLDDPGAQGHHVRVVMQQAYFDGGVAGRVQVGA